MSANDYYGKPAQGGYYPPPPGQQGGYYPQQPQQSYQGYGGPPPPQGYGPGPGYAPHGPPQTVYVQQAPPAQSNGTCMACLAGICLCCCAEELCECLF